MQVRFHSTWLADATKSAAASGFRVVTDSLIQSVARIRADTVANHDRQNISIRVSFTVAKLFATHTDAEVFTLGHGDTVKRLGKGTLTFTGHAVGYSMGLTNAIPDNISSRCVGLTVFTDYTFVGTGWD